MILRVTTFALLTVGGVTRPALTGPRIVVSDVTGFQEALGSDRTIVLEPGDYLFERGIQITGLTNLQIVGEGAGVRILAKDRYQDVLTLDQVKNLEIRNVTLGHEPEGYCLGGVVLARRSQNIRIVNAVLFGSGIEGLTLFDVEDLHLEDSEIRDCSYHAMTVVDSRQIRITDTKIARSQNLKVISSDVLVERATIFTEPAAYPVFDVDGEPPDHLAYKGIRPASASTSTVAVRDSELTGIYFPELLEHIGPLTQTALVTNRPDRVSLEESRLDLDVSRIDGTRGAWVRVPGVTFLRPGRNSIGRMPPDLSGEWWALCESNALRAVTLQPRPFQSACRDGIELTAGECPAQLFIRGASWAREETLRVGSFRQDGSQAILTFGESTWMLDERPLGGSGFELVLSAGSKRQILYSAGYTDEGGRGVAWIGDLDGDGLADLILSASHKYSVSCSHVFLSRYASPGEFLALVAEFCGTAC